MKVKSDFVNFLFHLDKSYSVLNARNVLVVIEFFKKLDIHGTMALNDIQFCQFMRGVTDLGTSRIYTVFDMLDVDGSGEIELDEFYLILCILIATKDQEEKEFIFRHSRTVFDILDEDGSNTISADEFENFGFLFNFQGMAIKKIFNEFDISGDQELDYKEFRMFAMACIDMQQEIQAEKQNQVKAKEEAIQNEEKGQQQGYANRDYTAAFHIPDEAVSHNLDAIQEELEIEEVQEESDVDVMDPADVEQALRYSKTRHGRTSDPRSSTAGRVQASQTSLSTSESKQSSSLKSEEDVISLEGRRKLCAIQ